jgi:hypothetical protein
MQKIKIPSSGPKFKPKQADRVDVENVFQVQTWKAAQTEGTSAKKYKPLPDYTELDPRIWHSSCLFAFVCGLFNDTARKSYYTASLIMNWKGYGRKRSLPDLRCHLSTCFEERRKTTKDLGQGSRYPDMNSNTSHKM